jgi:hypothetical protein
MEDAEDLYRELQETGDWNRNSKKKVMFAYTAVDENEVESYQHDPNKSNPKAENLSEKFNAEELTAFLANLKDSDNKENRYKWKYKPPKNGEPSTKKVLQDGKRKVYHWCVYHKQWTLHKPSECKRYPTKRLRNEDKEQRNTEFKRKKQAYLEAKAALEAFSFKTDSESSDDESVNKEGSNTSYPSSDDTDGSNTS